MTGPLAPVQPTVLTSAQRSELRGRAHHLDPVVMIGDAGLTAPVMAEIERALDAHELIKIRVFGDDRTARVQMLADICAGSGCAVVQTIGKLLVVWRPAPDPLTAGKSDKAIARKAKAIKAKENRAKAVKVRRKMSRSKADKAKAPAKRWFAPGKARDAEPQSGEGAINSGPRSGPPRRITRSAR